MKILTYRSIKNISLQFDWLFSYFTNMKKILILIAWLPLVSFGQEQENYPRDTSYTVYSVYKKLQKRHPYVEMVLPELPENVTHQKDIVYREIGERRLRLDVFHAKHEKSVAQPSILLIHGGGWRTGDKSLMFPLAEQLASRGYTVVVPEYRRSIEAMYPAAVHDLKTAIRWMREKSSEYPIDTNRLVVMGCSAGGQLAALLGTTGDLDKLEGDGPYQQHSSAVHAIVDVDGVLAFIHPESEEGLMASQWLGGSYDDPTPNWAEASALTHAGKNTPPILFIGSGNPRFLSGRADMINILEEHGIYNETKILEQAPHSFWLVHPWYETTLEIATGFLGKIWKHQE